LEASARLVRRGANRFYDATREQVIHTNLDSLFNMTRPVINGMRERNFGEKLRWSSSRAMMAWGAILLL
jgi:NADP-dependent 3-hydroxy acid dehydrogenase YdfG